jgi:outer membrane murein-binding lipoprotein Lpp
MWDWPVRVAAVMLTVTLLAGCADGQAPDAERGRQADETRESIVTDLQATQTWNLIHGTPESTPAPGE